MMKVKWIKNIVLIILFLSALTVIFSCFPTSQTALKGTESIVPVVVEKKDKELSSWQEEWAKSLAMARKEGRVLVYSTAGSETRAAIINSYKAFSGLDADVVLGKGADVSEKILNERRAGLKLADVYIGGSTTLVTVLKPSGALGNLEEYLILPEVKNSEGWLDGRLPFLDKDKTILQFWVRPNVPVVLNTSLVKPDELQSYRDFLQSKWKGKIIMNDPTIAGTGLKWFGVIGTKIMNMDFMKELAKQEPLITRDQRLQVDWLARGKYPIAVAVKDDPLEEYIRAGAPIAYHTPKEGTYLSSGSGNIAVLGDMPHPHSARIFINWLLSKEGQLAMARAQRDQSARIDIPTDYVEPLKLRNPGIKYFVSEDEEFLKQQPEQARMAQEIFGHLMK